jgi:glycosyltransferase involved in cell wall biosynthesis
MKRFFSFLGGRGKDPASGRIAARNEADVATATEEKPLSYLLRDPLHSEARSVLVLADGPGATQTISFDLPLRAVRRNGRVSLAIIGESEFEQKTPRAATARLRQCFAERRPEVVVASRFAGLGAHAIPALCGEFGARLVLHLDDDLFSVPPDLGKAKFEKYANPARKNRLRLLCERSRLVYASTSPLKDRLTTLGVATPVVAGEFYCPAVADAAPFQPATPPVFGYMGSSGHLADLQMIAPSIAAVLEAVPAARFETFGSIRPSEELVRRFPARVAAHKAAASYEEFLRLLAQRGWSCGLAPLAPTPFNDCKADTKFVEYSIAGIPTVASDCVVYRKSAGHGRGALVTDVNDWTAAIRNLIEDRGVAAAQVERAQNWLCEFYSVERLAAQVLNVLGLDTPARVAR